MIDFHTHILPGIDDGSKDVEETIGLLKEECRQGVDRIVATPHFYANRVGVEDFLRRREESIRNTGAYLEQLEQRGQGFAVPDVLFGAEVYFFPGMGRAEKLPQLCVTGTDYILIEMPFEQWTESVLRELRDVLQKQRLQVVLAHVERYPEFQRDKRVFEQVLDLPLTIQLNGGSFLKSRTKRKFCLHVLKEFDNVILGSDTHNLSTRTPNLQEARAVIAKKLGADRVAQIDRLMEQMLP